MPIRSHLTFANFASATALVVAVTGVGGLAVADGTVSRLAKNSVTSKHIKDGTIKPADLKDGAVTGAKVADDSLSGNDVAEGTLAQVPSAGTAANSGDLLRAVVQANGTLVTGRSEHAVSSSGSNGFYTVVFDRNVASCTLVVTAAALDTSPYGAHSSATLSTMNANAVTVWTLAASNNAITASPFHLIVAC